MPKDRARTRGAVLTVRELQKLLGIGRAAAYALARRIGRRVSGKRRGRLIIGRAAVDTWLANGGSRS